MGGSLPRVTIDELAAKVLRTLLGAQLRMHRNGDVGKPATAHPRKIASVGKLARLLT